MKIILYIAIVALPLMAFKGGSSEDKAYKKVAKDMCKCFNSATSGLSKEGRQAIEEAGVQGVDMTQAIYAFAEKYPMKAKKDAEILSGLGSGEINSCINNLEAKHSSIYSAGSTEEIESKLIVEMKKIKSCRLTYAFYQAGSQAKEKEGKD